MGKPRHSIPVLIFLPVVLMTVITGAVFAHVIDAILPRVTFTVQETYNLNDVVIVEAVCSDVDYISWRLLCDGKAAPFEVSDSGISFVSQEAGKYILRATAFRNGLATTHTESFTVADGQPSIQLHAATKTYTGEPFTVEVVTENIPLNAGSDYFKWEIRKDGVSYMDLQPTNGVVTFTEPGIYTIYARGYDLNHNIRVRAEENLLVVDRWPSGYQAGAAENGVNRRAIFSWESQYTTSEKEQLLHTVMATLNCDTIYQKISSHASDNEIVDFLRYRQSDGHRVYYLCGEYTWATEPDAASMLEQLNRVIDLNKAAQAAGVQGFYGIQYDVEKLSTKETMDQVVENYKTVYSVARANNIKVEACISYALDSVYGFEAQLEDLIAHGCDSVAIMNYKKGDSEPRHLQYELELCRRYNKGIVNITEMKKPGGVHNLTPEQTYYDDGIAAVEQMWGELETVFDYPVGFAFHYMKPIVELLGLS